MQAIVWLKTPIQCANNSFASVLICNIESWNADNVEVVFQEGQKLLADHAGILIAESIDSAKWLVTERSGDLMPGAWDISLS